MSEGKIFTEIATKVAISEEAIISLLSAAFHGGGSAHWVSGVIALEQGAQFECVEERMMSAGFRVQLQESVDGKNFRTVVRGDMITGLQLLATKYSHHFADIVNDSADAITADAFIQCCCFGDIIYS